MNPGALPPRGLYEAQGGTTGADFYGPGAHQYHYQQQLTLCKHLRSATVGKRQMRTVLELAPITNKFPSG